MLPRWGLFASIASVRVRPLGGDIFFFWVLFFLPTVSWGDGCSQHRHIGRQPGSVFFQVPWQLDGSLVLSNHGALQGLCQTIIFGTMSPGCTIQSSAMRFWIVRYSTFGIDELAAKSLCMRRMSLYGYHSFGHWRVDIHVHFYSLITIITRVTVNLLNLQHIRMFPF